MKHPTTNISRSGRSRLATQISLAFGATAMMAAGSALAAGSSDSSGMSNFRSAFVNNVVKGTRVHGRAGIYDFRRWHNLNDAYAPNGQKTNRSTAYGGYLQIHTGMVYGFSLGSSIVFEKNFYNPQSGKYQKNPNLVGGNSTKQNLFGDHANSNISQLYLQYNAPGFQARYGRQLISTPFASNDRFSFNPRTFRGLTTIFEPLKIVGKKKSSMDGYKMGNGGRAAAPDLSMNAYMPLSDSASNGQSWKIYGAEFTRMKARGSGYFGNNFFRGSNFYGLNKKNNSSTPGIWALGTSYRKNTPHGNYMFQFYHDTFEHIENLEYVEGGYIAPASGSQNFAPYIRAQYVRADGTENLASNLQGHGGIKSDIFGVKLGFKSNYVNGAVFANYSPQHKGTLGDGQILHPYSDLSGYLYSDTMNDGIEENGPGYAAGASLSVKPGYGLGMSTKFSWYHAKQGNGHAYYSIGSKACPGGVPTGVASQCGSENSYGLNVGLSYNFGYLRKYLTGLHVSDTLGITHYNSDTPKHTFYDNRFRFYYSF